MLIIYLFLLSSKAYINLTTQHCSNFFLLIIRPFNSAFPDVKIDNLKKLRRQYVPFFLEGQNNL
jgi:hypothetical protein